MKNIVMLVKKVLVERTAVTAVEYAIIAVIMSGLVLLMVSNKDVMQAIANALGVVIDTVDSAKS